MDFESGKSDTEVEFEVELDGPLFEVVVHT